MCLPPWVSSWVVGFEGDCFRWWWGTLLEAAGRGGVAEEINPVLVLVNASFFDEEGEEAEDPERVGWRVSGATLTRLLAVSDVAMIRSSFFSRSCVGDDHPRLFIRGKEKTTGTPDIFIECTWEQRKCCLSVYKFGFGDWRRSRLRFNFFNFFLLIELTLPKLMHFNSLLSFITLVAILLNASKGHGIDGDGLIKCTASDSNNINTSTSPVLLSRRGNVFCKPTTKISIILDHQTTNGGTISSQIQLHELNTARDLRLNFIKRGIFRSNDHLAFKHKGKLLTAKHDDNLPIDELLDIHRGVDSKPFVVLMSSNEYLTLKFHNHSAGQQQQQQQQISLFIDLYRIYNARQLRGYLFDKKLMSPSCSFVLVPTPAAAPPIILNHHDEKKTPVYRLYHSQELKDITISN